MRIDNIPQIDNIWYEDEDGNVLDVDWKNGQPEFLSEKKYYQHCKNIVSTYSIYTNYKQAKWPIRAIKWVVDKLPNSWKEQPCNVATFNSSINCIYPIVKYFVENKGWSFSDACILGADLCERCLNIALWEIEGHDLSKEQSYLNMVRTQCNYCKYIDPDYENRLRVRCCYRTLKLGGDVGKAFDCASVNSPLGTLSQ